MCARLLWIRSRTRERGRRVDGRADRLETPWLECVNFYKNYLYCMFSILLTAVTIVLASASANPWNHDATYMRQPTQAGT